MSSMNTGLVIGANHIGGLIGEGVNELFIYNSLNVGNINTSTTPTNVGAIAGKIASLNDIDKVFYYTTILSNDIEVSGIDFGVKVTEISLFNLEFFNSTLGWDTEVWDFTGLDIANGVYPTLKNLPVAEQ